MRKLLALAVVTGTTVALYSAPVIGGWSWVRHGAQGWSWV